MSKGVHDKLPGPARRRSPAGTGRVDEGAQGGREMPCGLGMNGPKVPAPSLTCKPKSRAFVCPEPA